MTAEQARSDFRSSCLSCVYQAPSIHAVTPFPVQSVRKLIWQCGLKRTLTWH